MHITALTEVIIPAPTLRTREPSAGAPLLRRPTLAVVVVAAVAATVVVVVVVGGGDVDVVLVVTPVDKMNKEFK